MSKTKEEKIVLWEELPTEEMLEEFFKTRAGIGDMTDVSEDRSKRYFINQSAEYIVDKYFDWAKRKLSADIKANPKFADRNLEFDTPEFRIEIRRILTDGSIVGRYW